MEKPKCKLCGERHWGGCAASKSLGEVIGDGIVAAGPKRIARARAAIIPSHNKQLKEQTIAPPGVCASCDARRAEIRAAVARHRARRKSPTT